MHCHLQGMGAFLVVLSANEICGVCTRGKAFSAVALQLWNSFPWEACLLLRCVSFADWWKQIFCWPFSNYIWCCCPGVRGGGTFVTLCIFILVSFNLFIYLQQYCIFLTHPVGGRGRDKNKSFMAGVRFSLGASWFASISSAFKAAGYARWHTNLIKVCRSYGLVALRAGDNNPSFLFLVPFALLDLYALWHRFWSCNLWEAPCIQMAL